MLRGMGALVTTFEGVASPVLTVSEMYRCVSETGTCWIEQHKLIVFLVVSNFLLGNEYNVGIYNMGPCMLLMNTIILSLG